MKKNKYGFDFGPTGTYVKVVVSNELYLWLEGKQFANAYEGTGMFFKREDLTKYANPEYWKRHEDEMPSEAAFEELKEIFKRYNEFDLFIFY